MDAVSCVCVCVRVHACVRVSKIIKEKRDHGFERKWGMGGVGEGREEG